MAPVCRRCTRKHYRGLIPLLNAVLTNMQSMLNSISLVRTRAQDSDEEDGGLLGAAEELAETVFWTVAEWRVTSLRPKICWSYPGRSSWFHDTVLQYWDDQQWIENFRMTRQTLFEISELLRPFLMRKDTVMRSAVPVEERVAIGVYFLASRSCYRTIALVFHRGTSTVASAVVEFCLAIEHTLLRKEVHVSDFTKMTASTSKLGFPHCLGAVDGTHLAISPPKLQGAAYFNRKSFHSVLLQAACDGDGVFFSMVTGHSGVNHDAHVFRSSKLYVRMEEGTLVPGNPMFHYAGVSIPPLILGDAAYPLCKWLMKPYAVPRNDTEKHYNKVFNRTRNIVERAFGRLKARFRRLSVRMEAHIQNVNSIVASAVILHNICERKKHAIPEEYDDTANGTESQCNDLQEDGGMRGQRERVEAEAIRAAVAEYLYTHVK
ncbi:hypothetical protein JRQ81_014375 [Phrynocephalus forsythii]|uniref:DDE Tnp4 domain-containing protein n=1 Tax=Phrynocephalus forsythii TaxID=171643 RepID=A0A9Q0XXM1_9SAUR|nr:hypothetical protein JRQ81_014375 [Phrynocephalus forsythii]